MTIAGIEDSIIATVTSLGLFAVVDSLGRHGEPDVLGYPAALAYFAGDGDANGIRTAEYHVQVRAQNVASEAAAARDAYVLIDAVRGAIHGRPLFSGEPPARCVSRELSGWDEAESVIEYTLKFQIEKQITIGM